MRVFVDTNVFLDIALQRERYRESLIVFKAIKEGVFEGVVADITLLNVDYVSRKMQGDVRAFLSAIERYHTIVGADNRVIRDALALGHDDFEDAVQYLLARQSQCDCIITNDVSFYSGEIETLGSDAFVGKYLL